MLLIDPFCNSRINKAPIERIWAEYTVDITLELLRTTNQCVNKGFVVQCVGKMYFHHSNSGNNISNSQEKRKEQKQSTAFT